MQKTMVQSNYHKLIPGTGYILYFCKKRRPRFDLLAMRSTTQALTLTHCYRAVLIVANVYSQSLDD